MNWYFDNIGVLFLIGVIFIVFISVLGSGKKKKQHIAHNNVKNPIQETKSMTIEEARQRIGEIKELTKELKWKTDLQKVLPIAKFRLEELKRHNTNLETGKTPEILESSVMNIISNLEWFVEQEKEYPGAPWLITNNPAELINHVKNRYNQMLLRLACDAFNDYKIKMKELVSADLKTEHTHIVFETIDCMRGFADTKASNHQQLFDELNKLHYQVEEMFSNISSISDNEQNDFDKQELEGLRNTLYGNIQDEKEYREKRVQRFKDAIYGNNKN